MMYTRIASISFVTAQLFFQALVYALVALIAGGRGLAQSPRVASPKLIKSTTPPPEIPPIVLDRSVHEDDYLSGTPFGDEEEAIESRRHSRRRSSAYPTHTFAKVDEKHGAHHDNEGDDDDDYEDITDDDDEISSIHSSDIDDNRSNIIDTVQKRFC